MADETVSMKTQRTIVILVVIVTLLGLGAMRRGGVRSALGLPPTAQAGTIFGSLEFDGRTRSYLVHPPRGYRPGAPLPVVFVLHGATESNDGVEELSRMSVKADAEHFIVVYPAGTGRVVTWNAGNCCGSAMKENVDDIGFLRALLEKIKRDYAIDSQRVYFTGISNGGMMAYRVACEMAEQVAAIAPVEGALNVECHPAAPVSVMIFHGTADRLVPFEGGSTQYQLGDERRDNSVAGAVNFWVKRDGCVPPPTQEITPEVHIDKFSNCQQGTAVELYAIQGGHHMWPGRALSGNRVAATDLMWDFFVAHPKR
jgi:polyhydroxybutyrate depolymerase